MNGTTEIEKAIYDIEQSLNITKGSSNFKEAALVLQWFVKTKVLREYLAFVTYNSIDENNKHSDQNNGVGNLMTPLFCTKITYMQCIFLDPKYSLFDFLTNVCKTTEYYTEKQTSVLPFNLVVLSCRSSGSISHVIMLNSLIVCIYMLYTARSDKSTFRFLPVV